MNRYSLNMSQFGFSGVSFWLTCFAIAWLLGAIGLGWLVNSILILIGLLILLPILAIFGFRWWLQRNLVQAQCPVCAYELTGLNQTELQCPNCQEPLKAEAGQFVRLTAPGTIDVQAVEVSARPVDD
jgi:hypothetical protein